MHPLDLTDDGSVDAFAKAVARRPRRRRGARVATPATSRPGVVHEIDTERFAQRARGQPARRPPAGARASCRAWSSAGAATSCSSPPTWRVRPRPFMAAVRRRQVGARGPRRTSMQMELEGTGVRVSIVRPGPTWSEMGTDLGRRGRPPTCSTSGSASACARHPHFLKPDGDRRRHRHGRQRAARRAPEPRRSRTPKHPWRSA